MTALLGQFLMPIELRVRVVRKVVTPRRLLGQKRTVTSARVAHSVLSVRLFARIVRRVRIVKVKQVNA